MNYHHYYHAGSFADVFKHSILVALLQHFKQKEAPFCYIDTHAATGWYDLTCIEALKTREHQQGIAKLYSVKSPLTPELELYLNIVKKINGQQKLCFYPGSPYIAQQLLRPQDKMILNEWHPTDCEILRQHMQSAKHCAIHQRDAHECLPAILPPEVKRGLIFIDPSFEKEKEFTFILNTLKKSLKSFGHGVYAVWYPIKDNSHEKFIKQVTALTPNVSNHTFSIPVDPSYPNRLYDNGVLIVNPPWKIDEQISAIQKILSTIMDS